MANERDDPTVAALCAEKKPAQGPALLRCADAMASTGKGQQAAALAKDAWINAITDPATEAAFLRRFPTLLTPADHWARFQHLAWANTDAASRQIAFLDPGHIAEASGRLGLKADDTRYQPAGDPGAMLDLARAYRRLHQDAAAVALWKAAGAAAQKAAPDHLDAFWNERQLLARALLHDGDPAGAYAIMDAHGQTDPANAAEAEFLAGFLALRRLNDPASAARHFTALAAASPAVLTQSRAYYWLGRARQAAGGDGHAEYTLAASYPMTFYGQLASKAAGQPDTALIQALRAPPIATPGLTQPNELAHAAQILLAWGDAKRARAFVTRMEEQARTPAGRIAAGDYGTLIGLPDIAVTVARRLGRDGLMPPMQGWPAPYDPPPVLDPAISLAIMRQESNFDVAIVSRSGALGLMQLMPATAAVVARKLGEPVSTTALVSDPAANMRLGTAYLREVLEKFDNFVPLAAAAYNAGPNRASQWIAESGDPRLPGVSMIDWIEFIPFNETRNYVQRVLENYVVYEARRAGALPATMTQWNR